MKPEEEARQKIDELLELAGWKVQDLKEMDLGASFGVAVREFPLKTGPTDYLLFVDRKAVGVLEAKPEGTTLSGVAEQTEKYIAGVPKNLPQVHEPLPFAYESTGVETFFRDKRDPDARSRQVFAFHRPETLLEWANDDTTLRARLKKLPPLIKEGLRPCQVEAITNLEKSLASGKPRALIQMASGSGKTYTAVNSIYRLIKFGKARRVLFLVDRSNLGRQAKKEFMQFVTPDDGRKFTDLYNVQHLTTSNIDPVSNVCITTIQRLYSILSGKEIEPELEEASLFDNPELFGRPKDVVYNSSVPIEMFDVVIIDECHRSIYNVWRQVLDYFDAFDIGLTATPAKQTLGFFKQNLVTEYGHDRAVADGINVGYDIYKIRTEITTKGSKVDAGYYIDVRDKLSRRVKWQQLDEGLEYSPSQLDRAVVAPDQIRTVIKTFKDLLFTDIFPGRTEVPKTLIFAKDDSHAEDIVQIAREEFGKGNDFCKKITYKTTGEKAEDLIASFRNSYNPRIAVTVDMISTGTDIRPLECLVFMREVRSRTYFEQMKGRGTRTVSDTDLRAVTPDALHKTHFVIVDAVGVCETDKTDSRSLEKKKTVPFYKLLLSVALGNKDKDTLSSLAGRLARLDRELDEGERKEIEGKAKQSMKQIINQIMDAIDPDKKVEKAKELFKTAEPNEQQVRKASDELTKTACAPFDSPSLRNALIEARNRSEQIIDTVSQDRLVSTGYDDTTAKSTIATFKRFIEENKDELTALQILYSKPYSRRHVTYEQVQQLAQALSKSPYSLSPVSVWKAYKKLEKSKVRGAGPTKLLTDIISLVRFAVGEREVLEPYSEEVEHRFKEWIGKHEKAGQQFTPQQMEWLTMIKDHIATSLEITIDDFGLAPFYEQGGAVKFYQVFGRDTDKILAELNEALVA
ncbi:MAG: type I restriction-modification enzyme R subunit C-terminal domain-containing protein [Candidatus Micrarchaeia archaeon]|jgi:type I restriction enzyme R subunit